MPVEMLYELCSTASAKELFMSYRLVNKDFHKAALIILCQKQEKENFYYQNLLFKTPLKQFLLEDNDFIKTLLVSIQQSMQSPLSDSNHKLNALLFMADIKGITIEVSDVFVDVLRVNLPEIQNNLSCLVFKMTPLQINNMVKAVIIDVNNPDQINYNSILKVFKVLIAHVDKIQIATLIADAMAHLNTNNPSRKTALLALLKVLVIRADKTQMNDIINAVTALLDSNYQNTVNEASNTLIFLASYVFDSDLNTLIATIKAKVMGRNDVNQGALTFVAASPLYATKTQVHGLINELILELSETL